MFIKIDNLFQNDGKADYKGLDLANIIPGSQLYPKDSNAAYLKVSASVVHEDVTLIDESVYESVRLQEESYAKLNSQEERIKGLEDTLNMLLLGGL